MKKGILFILKGIGILLLAVVVVFIAIIGVLTVTEYKPEDVEELALQGESTSGVTPGESLTVMTWNIGYGALGENADFFMDGGSHVSTADEEEVYRNLDGILETVAGADPDIVLFQEVDRKAKRSHFIDEEAYLYSMSGMDGMESFAYNYKTLYVPYPIPTIGRVEAGLMTLSRYQVDSARRIQLPCPFSYPVRLANLKRCLMVDRIPVEGSDKELVVVNLHLEAYDSGEGKIAQTAMLKELLITEAEKGNYVIAGGDFNQTFSNVDTDMYPTISDEMWVPGEIDVSEFGNSLEFVADNSAPTCRSLDRPYAGSDRENFQYYMIDGFIVSSNVNVETIETLNGEFVFTDHNPVVLKVTLD